MAIASNIIGISAGSGSQQFQVDFTNMENTLAAILIEARMLNFNTAIIGSGQAVIDDPNVYRLDALANGLYANPPVTPTAGQD